MFYIYEGFYFEDVNFNTQAHARHAMKEQFMKFFESKRARKLSCSSQPKVHFNGLRDLHNLIYIV